MYTMEQIKWISDQNFTDTYVNLDLNATEFFLQSIWPN